MLALPMGYFYARRTGDIQRRLVGMRQVRQFIVQNGVAAITSVAQLSLAVALIFVYSRVLALVFLAAVPLYVALMRFAVRRIRPLMDSLEESFGRYHSLRVDAVKGIDGEGARRRGLAAPLDGERVRRPLEPPVQGRPGGHVVPRGRPDRDLPLRGPYSSGSGPSKS